MLFIKDEPEEVIKKNIIVIFEFNFYCLYKTYRCICLNYTEDFPNNIGK